MTLRSDHIIPIFITLRKTRAAPANEQVQCGRGSAWQGDHGARTRRWMSKKYRRLVIFDLPRTTKRLEQACR